MSASPAEQENDSLALPAELDEYKLIRSIGSGGMGQVFLAHDTLLDRPVAIKFIRALQPDANTRAQFLTEARSAARLQHPNVCTVHRIGEYQGKPYIVSEFIRGTSLSSMQKPLPWKQVLDVGLGLARGLAAAHRSGVLHRDIKPANVLLTDAEEIKLVDFGVAELMPGGPALEARTGGGAAGGGAPVAKPAAESARDSTVELGPNGNLKADARKDDTLPARNTDPHRVVGTPDYIAPEVWAGEGASRRSDVYALGILLYELCTGTPPHYEVPLDDLPHVVQVQDSRPLALAAPEVDSRFAAVVDRCLRREPTERYSSAEEIRDSLELLIPRGNANGAVPEGNPYRGLQAFEAEHGALFFGRDRDTRAVLERLRSETFVLLAGDSGVGKSSVCRAGVMPLIATGALGGDREWLPISFVPGRRPMSALLAALAGALDVDDQALYDELRKEDVPLATILRRRLGTERGIVLLVDQLEELVTLADPKEAETFAKRLEEALVPNLPIRLLATVRGDFLARIALLPGMGDRVGRALYVLHQLSEDGIRDAIVGPATAKGFRYESAAFVQTLVDSTSQTEGGLPLLQFALAELWEARDVEKKIIPASAMAAIGGVAGALARHADQVLEQMLPRQRATARRMLLQLVTAEGTRARRSAAELGTDAPEAKLALEAMVNGRLLVVREAEGGSVYEVAHEALLSGWTTLRQWIESQADTRQVRERLITAATEWNRLGRVAEALWGASQLKEVEGVDREILGPREQDFLAASWVTLRRQRWLRYGLIAALPLLILGIYIGLRTRESRMRREQISARVKEADEITMQARAQRDRVIGARQEAFRLFDARQSEGAEEAWTRALEMREAADTLYKKASLMLETAVMVDPTRKDVRGQFADLILERALFAEEVADKTGLHERLERLQSHDEDGQRIQRFMEPAKLVIETYPRDAKIEIHRYQSERGRRKPVHVGDTTPGTSVSLEPGSYLLILHSPSRVDVRYPILLRRSEQRTVQVDLPAKSEVPEGFVYIPGGTFLFGTGADESLRRFYETAPLHETTTNPFMIAKRETTYGEWIAYLDDLPAAERQRRTPDVGAAIALHHGVVRMSWHGPGKWSIRLQPTNQAYSARMGQMIVYEARTRKQTQNWLKMPVGGVSFYDAEQYAAWLDRTGRVPGARLCTEHEWERAARGADDREFPSGDVLRPEDANIDITYGKIPLAMGPDEVGTHPGSDSPFGIQDLSGNVFEWIVGSFGDAQVSLRGGGFYHAYDVGRVVNRQVPEPSLRDLGIGLRICASPPVGKESHPARRINKKL